MQSIEFAAPWGKVLKTATTLTMALLAVMIALVLFFASDRPVATLIAVLVVATILLAAAFCTVRG